ncbi:MAG: hypothetical protein GX621_17730 [Pirellulaceae bacterium]|nr:hypothetical protein [Pirellulaceae bacterium]
MNRRMTAVGTISLLIESRVADLVAFGASKVLFDLNRFADRIAWNVLRRTEVPRES